MIYVIAQIIGFMAFIVALISYHQKTKKKIFSTMVFCHILYIIHYLLLNAYSGFTTKILAVLRDSFIVIKDRFSKTTNHIVLFIFIILYIVAAIFTYNGILSILPLLAALIYIIFIWNGTALQVKKAAFYCYFLWLIYNIFVLSIAGIIANIVSIISTFIAIQNAKKILKLII